MKDRLVREYDRAAAKYDRRWARYTADSLDLLRPWIEGRHLGRVLDVGGGTGALLDFLPRWNASVDSYACVDPSPGMLGEGARVRRIAPLCAAAEALPLAGASFDTAVSASSLHFFADRPAGLREIHRVLRPGGRLLLVDWDGAPLRMRLLDGYLRAAPWIAHRGMLSTASIRRLLVDTGFTVDDEARGGAWPAWRLAAFVAIPRSADPIVRNVWRWT